MTAAYKPRKAPGPTEAALQRSVADLLHTLLEPPVVWTAIQPERRGPLEGRRMKDKGVRAGWPDFLVIAPGPRMVGIELKAGRNKQSAEQMIFAGWFKQCHGLYFVCRSQGDVLEALDAARIRHRAMRTQGSSWERVG